MGKLTVAMVNDDPGMALAATITRDDPLEGCIGADVVVDFSTADSAFETAAFAIKNGIHVILGVSGVKEARIAELYEALGDSPSSAVLLIPNFSVAALLARKFAVMAAKYFDSCEIIEYAHALKVDAPSGTALEAAIELGPLLGSHGGPSPSDGPHGVEGSRGALAHGIPIHSIRLEGFMNHQTILLGGPGGVISLKYDTLDRSAYLPGIRLAVNEALTRSGLYRGLESIIKF